MEGQAGKLVFLLAAKKVPKSRTSHYRISSTQGDCSKTAKGYRGKIRSNFVGTMFTAYGKGSAVAKAPNPEAPELRNEFVSVLYVGPLSC